MRNFTNGALVFRVWRCGGDGEVIGKFQYTNDAKLFAKAYTEGADRTNDWFLLVVCEYDCEVATFLPAPLEREKSDA